MAFEKLKSVALLWLPPIVVRLLREFQSGHIRFSGDYENWEVAATKCSGYDSEKILAKVLNATLKVQRGEAAYERDSVLFDRAEYVWPLLAGLMWAAARNDGSLNVLDFGGALGSSYFQNRKFLQSLSTVRWNVVEQAHYVTAGQLKIGDEQLQFYKSIEDCLAENQPNVILLSSVLQYLETPTEVLKKLSTIGAACFIIDRTPISNHNEDKICVQHVPPSIYDASYPMRVFSRKKLDDVLAEDWSLVARSLCPEGGVRTEGNLEFFFEGMLLEPRK